MVNEEKAKCCFLLDHNDVTAEVTESFRFYGMIQRGGILAVIPMPSISTMLYKIIQLKERSRSLTVSNK